MALTSHTLFDANGNHKYLVARERKAFAAAAVAESGTISTFCLMLSFRL